MRRRFLLLSVASAAGCAAFIPFLAAGSGSPASSLLLPLGIVSLISVAAIYPGLRLADAAQLPMPWLRAVEHGGAGSSQAAAATREAVVVGMIIGAMGIATVRALDLPDNPGSLGERVLSTLFAAVTLEVILHLFIMSGVAWLSGRRWAGIAVSTVAYVAFHVAGALALPAAALTAVVIIHVVAGVAFGCLFAWRGFEYLVLAHATAHFMAMVVN